MTMAFLMLDTRVIVVGVCKQGETLTLSNPKGSFNNYVDESRYSRVPNRSPCAFISGKVCLLGSTYQS